MPGRYIACMLVGLYSGVAVKRGSTVYRSTDHGSIPGSHYYYTHQGVWVYMHAWRSITSRNFYVYIKGKSCAQYIYYND